MFSNTAVPARMLPGKGSAASRADDSGGIIVSVYDGIMRGLDEALEYTEGKGELRTTPMFEPLQDDGADEKEKENG